MTVMTPETFEQAAADDGRVILGDPDPSAFESYEEYLAWERTLATDRQAETAEQAADAARFGVRVALLLVAFVVAVEGAESVMKKVRRGRFL